MKHKMNSIRLAKGMIINDYLKKIKNMKFMLASKDEIVQERESVECMINYLPPP